MSKMDVLPLWFLCLAPFSTMAEIPQHRCERRAAARAIHEDEGRCVRQRLDNLETLLDSVDSRLAQHDMRPTSVVLAEAEGLICDDEGLVAAGIFPTGGPFGQCPDAILRLQPAWFGGRIC